MIGARGVALVVLAGFCAIILAAPSFVDPVRDIVFDGYQRLFPRERRSAPVTIVAIDEASLAEVGQWPWPRTRMAELVERISAARPAAIGLDMLFPEADRFSPPALASSMTDLPPEVRERLRALPESDARFASAIRGRKVVLAIAGLQVPDARFPGAPSAAPVQFLAGREPPLRTFPARLGSVPEIDAAAAGRGLITAEPGSRVARRTPLLAKVGGTVVPALSLELWRVAVGASTIRVREPGNGLLEIAIGDVRIPAQEDGSVWLRYGHPDSARFVSAAAVLRGQVDPELFRRKLVLIGVTGLGLLDYQATPLGERMPGVEIHAQLAEQIFDGAYLVRPAWARWLEAGLLAAGIGLLVLLIPVKRVWVSALALAGLLGLFALVGIAAFRLGHVLVDPAWPALGTAIGFAALLAATLAEADRQRRALREAAARAAGELAAARRIQMGLLPQLEALSGPDSGLALHAYVEPANSIGGDFYECLRLDRERLFFAVGDVSGKGMPAALFMALSKATLKAAAARGGEIGGMLARAEAEIGRNNPEQLFVTVFAAILDLRTGTLEYCNAGHEPPYLLRSTGALERLPRAGGPPLGVLEDYARVTEYRQLRPGDRVCVVSDGATEAMNAELQAYGGHRVEHVLKFLDVTADTAQIIAALREDIERFVGCAAASDDLTLLAVGWTGPPLPAGEDESADVDLDAPVAGLGDAVGSRD